LPFNIKVFICVLEYPSNFETSTLSNLCELNCLFIVNLRL
jgi:hypothetical protein